MVWVWDSTWFPAVVVHRVRMGRVLVRLEHGVTFSVTMADLLPHDPACRSGDMPSAGTRRLREAANKLEEIDYENY